MFGGADDDILIGGKGSDRLNGGRGDDTLTGDDGRDIFIFSRNSGEDRITDFNNNKERIDLNAFAVGNFKQLKKSGALVADGRDSIINLDKLGGDGAIYVDDMQLKDWDGRDFFF